MARDIRFSIIVPVSKADTYLAQCIEHCLKLETHPYEIILLTDGPADAPPPVRVIPTQTPSPSIKRNTGIASAQGEICAFLDADAYPPPDWLEKAEPYFNDPQVAAVGGPNLTPEEDTMLQKAAGFIMGSRLGGGMPDRVSPGEKHFCQELQTVNMMVRKSVLEETGGFDPTLWPGEDAKISYQISQKGKMLYAPEVKVYHHRRPLFKPFLRQMWRYGLTKPRAFQGGMSWKRLVYFIPTLFLLGLIIVPVLFIWLPVLYIPYLAVLGVYLLMLLWSSLKPPQAAIKALLIPGIFLTHMAYGLGFLAGWFHKGGKRQ